MTEDFATSGLIERLATRHRVIAVDRPSYGHSERPRDHTCGHCRPSPTTRRRRAVEAHPPSERTSGLTSPLASLLTICVLWPGPHRHPGECYAAVRRAAPAVIFGTVGKTSRSLSMTSSTRW